MSRRHRDAAPSRSRRSARRSPSFEGSVAIAAQSPPIPDRVLLAQRGSGQALYVGVADDAFVVASEPYGVVEECDRYLRLDGETMLEPGEPGDAGPDRRARPSARHVAASSGWSLRRLARCRSPTTSCTTPEITTRDVDRGDAPHYLLKEIYEVAGVVPQDAARQIVERRRPARGRACPPRRCPTPCSSGCAPATIAPRPRDRAGHRGDRGPEPRARAARRARADGRSRSRRSPRPSSRASGSTPTCRDTLVVAISQSGTTTDTNRTVDLVRARGAVVIAIVNRRQSDLVDKSDGVLYTSDGRDVEMSVASTKAFYAQIAAGFLLAFAHRGRARGRRRRRPRRPPRAARRAARAARRDARGARPARRRSRVAAQRHALVAPLVGGRRQRRQPGRGRRRSGSSSRSSVTSRSPATSPRTRSTSTCRPSR